MVGGLLLEEGRRNHIEVCARLRPLAVGKESSQDLFLDQQPWHASLLLRKPQLPRPTTTASRLASPPRETFPSSQAYAWKILSDDTITQSCHTDIVQGRTHQYTVDRVYGPDVTTQELYERSVQSLVRAAMDGYHTSVLAYGQTSTGKTHTMMGTKRQPGVIPLSIRECFSRIRQVQSGPSLEYLLRVSYLEVYKEHIRDLLVSNSLQTNGGSMLTASANVPIRLFDSANGLVIKGLVEEVVTTPEQVFQLLAQGEARRQVGATHLNQYSSRSHTIFRLWIESRRTGGSDSAVRLSSLSLVDLAGSESVRLTGSTERQQEGHYINKSLMTLGKVVYALSEGVENSKHVPYRDSKLTRLLQPSLSGSAQVVLICCISPIVSHIEESHNTFKFACRAKRIPQHAVIQEADEKSLLQSYRDEIEELKRQLREAGEERKQLLKTRSSISSAISAQPLAAYSDVDEDEISELVKSIQTMELLILKTRPFSRRSTSLTASSPSTSTHPETLFDIDMEFDRDDENLLVSADEEPPAIAPNHVSTPLRGPVTSADDFVLTTEEDSVLHSELSRIQGLLRSVIRKRSAAGSVASSRLGVVPSSRNNEEELRSLRAQLEMQEVASSFRKADASFLQQQLEEKDELLQEVSKILEAVEKRQIRLEEENAALRKELALLRKANSTAYRGEP
jgi:centromeric protein E